MADSILRGEHNVHMEQNVSSSDYKVQFAFSVFTITVNIVAAIAAVTLNSLLLHIYIRNQKSPSRILVCNLAVTDILTGLIVQPAYVVHIILDLQGTVSYTALLVFNFIAYLVCGMSLVTAGGMSLDRLCATIKPFSYKFYGRPKIFTAVVVFIWVQGICFVSLYTANAIDNSLAQLAFILTVAFAVISFVVSYAIIFKSMRTRERRVTNCGPQGPNTMRNQQVKRRKITRTFALMIIALCIMYFPMFIVKILLWRAKSSQLVVLNIANRVANTITFLNSLLNPLLYCYNNEAVRRQMIDLCFVFCRVMRRTPVQPIAQEDQGRRRFILLSSYS